MELQDDEALQVRCIYCKHEQYAPAVIPISKGEHPCVWCGIVPPRMSKERYQEEIRKEAKWKTKS